MFTSGECFFKRAICDLFSDDKERGLLCWYFKDFDNEIWFDIFEFFEIFWELDMREFNDLDGDLDIGFCLSALPDCVIIGGEEWFFSFKSILFKDFLMLLFHYIYVYSFEMLSIINNISLAIIGFIIFYFSFFMFCFSSLIYFIEII